MRPALIRHLLPLAAALLLTSAPLAGLAHGRIGLGLTLAIPLVVSPWGWGQVGVELPGPAVTVQFGGVHYRHHHGQWYRPWGPRWVVVVPPPGLALPPPTVAADAALPTAPTRPDPVVQPRQGQSAEQTEADRRECNRWATTQPAALADAAVFHRVVQGCMDGLGYSLD